MRLAPVPLFYAGDPQDAITKSGESSLTTHGAPTAVDACRYFGGLLVGAVHGVSKAQLLSTCYTPSGKTWHEADISPEIYEIACGSIIHRDPPDIQGTGYVVNSLEAALWAFHRSETFEAGCLMAVNLGNDADTTGAIYGQIAGAYYGMEGIPARWLETLSHRYLIEQYAEKLYRASHQE
jgi:ADP-ribosylglycohydrolase